ncbi:capsid protein [Paenochrobactrum glaciei]|uniref:Capsid protein n=1 Tax=Paenochrobactrum glaciei TaxID=486407 RepID=A0ABN1FXU3_9HYPH
MSTNRPFPIDATLTAISIGFRNPSHILIGRRVLPPLQVLSEEFKWNYYPLAQNFTLPETHVGRTSRPNQVEFEVEERTSATSDYGLDDAIPNSDITAAARARAEKRSSFDPRGAAVEGLTNLIELDREVRVAATMQNPNSYSDDRRIVLTGQNKFSDYANSDPYGVLDDALGKTLLYRPNRISMGGSVWSSIKRHPRMIKAVKGGMTEDGAITKQQFADLFEISVENVLIGEALLNTTRKGQKPSLSKVWGNSIQLTFIDTAKQSAKDYNPTFGYTAEYGSRISGSISDGDIGLEGGERIRVGERVKEVVCCKELGVLIQNPV